MRIGFISSGFNPPYSLTQEEVEFLKSSEYILIDSYTSPNYMKEFGSEKLVQLDREKLENFNWIFDLNSNVSIVSPGDIFAATTHFNIYMEAVKRGINVKIFHNASIYPAAATRLGLQIYKIGPPVSIPRFREGFRPYSAYDKILKNIQDGYHTILLLDTNPPLTLMEAIEELMEMEKERSGKIFHNDFQIAAISQLGMENEKIVFGKMKELRDVDLEPPISLVIPGKLHFLEEESLELFRIKDKYS